MAVNKEQIYDESIHPLMAEILAICQEHKIAMLATFAIPNEEDADLCCTSMTPDETGDNPRHHREAMRCIRGGINSALALTITTGAAA